jgi:hypothetical protein
VAFGWIRRGAASICAKTTPENQESVARAESAFREGGFPGNGQVLDPANAIRPGRISQKRLMAKKRASLRLTLGFRTLQAVNFARVFSPPL